MWEGGDYTRAWILGVGSEAILEAQQPTWTSTRTHAGDYLKASSAYGNPYFIRTCDALCGFVALTKGISTIELTFLRR